MVESGEVKKPNNFKKQIFLYFFFALCMIILKADKASSGHLPGSKNILIYLLFLCYFSLGFAKDVPYYKSERSST